MSKTVKKTEYIILFLAVAFCSLPLLYHGIEGHFGQDLGFHINRIEGIYLELKNGIFPVRMQSFWMDGYGYPVSIYYGDILLYLPAMLRLLGVPVVAAYKFFLLIINIITVLVAYRCFSRITADSFLGALAAFVYSTSNYRLLDLYIRAAVGEYTAMLFLPMVACGVCLIYGWTAQEEKDAKTEANFYLTLGMSGILLTHMMTLEITGICLIIICVINIKKTFTPEALSTYLISAAATLLITLFFTIPFVDYFLTENVRINQVVGNARQIQESGTRLYEFFDFFMIPFSNLDPSISDDRMLTTPGMVLMGVLVAAIAVIISKRADKRIKVLTLSAIILLFVSSDIFPWNALAKSSAIGDLLAQVQFPWRYVGLATVVLTLLLTALIGNKKNTRTAFIIISIGAAMCVWFFGVYGKYAELDTFETTADLDTYDMGFIEYLRPDAVREDFKKKIDVTAGEAEAYELERVGTSMDIYVMSPEGATIELPVLNYKYYTIRDEKGTSYAIMDGKNDEICFDVDAGFDGVIRLRYELPGFWHFAEWVSAISFICFLVIMGKKRGRG
ncbi:MAG: hypothetical protein K6B14_02070 [Lachnospiraceae bacterium]|nr:hypothetical protein [Lachnospiraceae bacterium]